MTFATSATSLPKSSRRPPRRAFTLVELLVVGGIILILIGLLLPMIVKTLGQGQKVRIRSDLNAIAAALEAYKQDFGDYPRIIYTDNTPFNGTGSGANVLCKALLGGGAQDGSSSFNSGTVAYSATVTYFPGQVVLSGAKHYSPLQTVVGVTPAYNDPTKNWVAVTISPDLTADATGRIGGGFDGADGPGFRVRTGGFGRVYGPYLDPDKFKTKGLSIVDFNGNPILYYPGNPAKPGVTVQLTAANTPSNLPTIGNAIISVPTNITPGTTPTVMPVASVSMYNFSDNDIAALQATDNNLANAFPSDTAGNGVRLMAAMLGDYTGLGWIDTSKGEAAATTGPYLLWSAGADGVFGPIDATQNLAGFASTYTDAQRKTSVGKCDDVTNFTFGQ